MSRLTDPSRRAVALLLVLAALVIVVTACAALAAAASMIKLRRGFDEDRRLALDLLRAADEPIGHWLTEVSAEIVLPPEATEPRLAVLHDAWRAGDSRHELRITAWDEEGMVPLEMARSSSPLRLALPEAVRDAVDRLQLDRGQVAGLDLFEGASPLGVATYPRAVPSRALWFAEDVGEERPVDEDHEARRVALGAYLATHGPRVVNVNTAPMALVEQALRAAGRGGIEMIEQARAEGRPAPLPPAPGTPGTPGTGGTGGPPKSARRSSIGLATTSGAFAFRIDARVGRARSSWWAVYVRERSGWRCVQRLAITD